MSWGTDIKTGVRSLMKTPVVTAATLISLGLSLSSASVLFGVMYALILKPLPFPDVDRVLLLWQSRLSDPSQLDDTAPANFVDWKRESRLFAHLAAYAAANYDLTEGGPPEEVAGAQVTPGFFASLGIEPRLGRDFTEEEGTGHGDRVAIISNELWARRFGAAPDILGKRLLLGGSSFLVIGVMPPGWYLLGDTAVWTPLAWPAGNLVRDDHFLSVVGRLRPGVSLDMAQEEMSSIGRQLTREYPDADAGYGVTLKPAEDVFPAQRDRRLIFLLSGIVGFVLLIACANIANLQFAKANGRATELATRSALGASRQALIWQQLIEILMLALCGGLIALTLTALELHLLKSSFFLSDSWNPIGLSWPVFLFTFALAFLASLISGLGPALRSSRPDLNRLLKQSGRTGSQSRSFWLLGRILVSVEVMIAVGLLSIGGDMIVSFIKLSHQSAGFDSRHLLTARVSLPTARYAADQFSDKQQVTRQLDAISNQLATLPSVEGVAYTNVLPRSESDPKAHFYRSDQRTLLGGQAPIASWRAVSANFFQVLKIPLAEGRSFTDQDQFGKEAVVIVSKSLAEQIFPGRSAVGQQIFLFDDARRIVGVVGGVLLNRSDTPPNAIYLPHGQSPRLGVSFLLRSRTDPLAIAAAVPARVWEVDSHQPVSRIVTFDQYEDLQFSGMRLTVHLLAALCVLAMVLAMIGLYGLVSYMVSERTNDFAIRFALGARRNNIFAMVIGEAAKAALPGILGGFLVVLLLRGVLGTYLQGVLQSGWLFPLLISVLLSITALLASLWPATRASLTDMAVLRRSA